jgi:hypothetical protein
VEWDMNRCRDRGKLRVQRLGFEEVGEFGWQGVVLEGIRLIVRELREA